MLTPSGSSPTLNEPSTFPLSTSSAVAALTSSLAMKRRLPSGVTATCSGSEPLGIVRTSFRSLMLTTPIPSALLSGGGSLLSSTPGPAIGEPLSATYSTEPSGASRRPRGRLPTWMVATSCCVPTSMTLRSPPLSLLTNSFGPGGTSRGAAGAGDDVVAPAPVPPGDEDDWLLHAPTKAQTAKASTRFMTPHCRPGSAQRSRCLGRVARALSGPRSALGQVVRLLPVGRELD